MRIVVINGSPRQGITYESMKVAMAEMQALGEVEFVEFHLPKDLPTFCRGCFQCFERGEHNCPNKAHVQPIVHEMLSADGWIIGSPTYAMQITAGLKSLFDHTAYCFLNHRPRFFRQKALVITTTAGAGAQGAGKYIAQALSFWGVSKVYRYGQPTLASKWDEMPQQAKEKLLANVRRVARLFYEDAHSGKMHTPSLLQTAMFNAGKAMALSYTDESADKQYWSEHGWLAQDRHYYLPNTKLDPCRRLIGALAFIIFSRMMKRNKTASPRS